MHDPAQPTSNSETRLSTAWAQLTIALLDGTTQGLREHMPAAVGILLRSFAVCASAWLTLHVVGASLDATTAGAGVGGVAAAIGGVRARA